MALSNDSDSSSANMKLAMVNSPSKSFFLAQIVLRSVTAMLALCSTIVMVKSGQTTTIFGIDFQAKYSYSSAFRFFVGTNIAVFGFSIISLIAICVFYGPKSDCKTYFSLFLHDLIAMALLISGCAAASAIGYVGKYGQEKTGWTKICDSVTKFCNFGTVSIALSYLAFICLFALTIMAFRQAHFQSARN